MVGSPFVGWSGGFRRGVRPVTGHWWTVGTVEVAAWSGGRGAVTGRW
ncbi:hypothetical protein [Streptomyces sp. NPDC046909]